MQGGEGILTQAGKQDEEGDDQRSRTNRPPATAGSLRRRGEVVVRWVDDDGGWLRLTFADGLMAVGTWPIRTTLGLGYYYKRPRQAQATLFFSKFDLTLLLPQKPYLPPLIIVKLDF